VPLKAHPEGFQLDPESGRVFVNLPDAQAIAVVDMAAKTQVASWPQAGRNGNFPMALKLVAAPSAGGLPQSGAAGDSLDDRRRCGPQKIETCADSDDVFVDAKRSRAYVTCGEGFRRRHRHQRESPTRIGHVATASGARTSLFVPDLDRLIIAVPARGATPAAVWVYRPDP